ncbi:MAG TPA: FGGY family carbohydrate kinase [Friedmanniella sp.]
MDAHPPLVLAVDQGTTNTKAALVTPAGDVVALGSAPVGVTSPRAGWVEQDPERIWRSVVEAVGTVLRGAVGQGVVTQGAVSTAVAGVALSTQRESVLAWRASTGRALGPVLGWQDSRTAAWCAEHVDAGARTEVHRRTGLRVDAMFSAPKLRWLLDHLPPGTDLADVRVGTVDAWLVWRLTGGREHLCEAGNASRTLLFDISELDWSDALLTVFGIPRAVLPAIRGSSDGFGTCLGVPGLADGTPVVAVLADSHAALYGHGCTTPGTAKATYGTGSSVMTPVRGLPSAESPVPTTLAWLLDGTPTYALEGNILSSGAALAWTADLLTGGDVGRLVDLAGTVPGSEGVTLVPAFTGLGAPHWDRDATALVSGLRTGSGPGHLARAACESVAHQVADVIDVVESVVGPLATLRADGGATAAGLLMQDQADLLALDVEVTDVAEVSALGAAKLGWQALGAGAAWVEPVAAHRYRPRPTTPGREERRATWRREVARARFVPPPGASADRPGQGGRS